MGEKRSPWGCVLGGCGVSLLVVVAVVVGLGFFGARKVKEISEDVKDPDRREAKVREVLGAERLPEGLYPVVGMSIPFLLP